MAVPSNFPRMRKRAGFPLKAPFQHASIENHRWKEAKRVFEAPHFTCQFDCTAQNTAPELVLTNDYSGIRHQQGLPFAVSRIDHVTETLAKSAAGSDCRAMVVNRQTKALPPAGNAAALSHGAQHFSALPHHTELLDQIGINQLQSSGAGCNRKRRATFYGQAAVRAWSLP